MKALSVTPDLRLKVIGGQDTIKVTPAIEQHYPDEGIEFMRIMRAMAIQYLGVGDGRVDKAEYEKRVDAFAHEAYRRLKTGYKSPLSVALKKIDRLKVHVKDLQLENMDLVGQVFKGEDAIAELTALKVWCWDHRQQLG